MKTWRRAPGIKSKRTGRFLAIRECGSCMARLTPQEPMLEIQIGEVKRYRCVACAKRMFWEDAPADIPEDAPVHGPQQQPSLPLTRAADFVTPAQLARSVQHDFRKRQTGETE